MKTLFTLALVGLFSISASANENLKDGSASAVKANFKKVNVLLKESLGQAQVEILDQKGVNLHSLSIDNINEDKVIPYNLESLPAGTYQVRISSDSEEVLYKVNTFERAVSNDGVSLKAHGSILDKNTIRLSVYGLLNSGVQVDMRSENDDSLIHTELLDTSESFNKDFILNGIEAEDVYFEITDNLGRTRVVHL